MGLSTISALGNGTIGAWSYGVGSSVRLFGWMDGEFFADAVLRVGL